MEPAQKKARLTDHFRVALKPRDLNVGQAKNKQQVNQKANEVITIGEQDASRAIAESKQLQQSRQNLSSDNRQHHNQLSIQNLLKQQKCDENKTQSQRPSSQQQTLPLKLFTFTNQSQQPQSKNIKPQLQTKQQPRQHLGPILLNQSKNHGRAPLKGNRSSIAGGLNNNLSLNLFDGNKSITSYFQKREPSPLNKYLEPPGRTQEVFDYDKTLLNNVLWEPHYAWESFDYDKQQEIKHRNMRPLSMINEIHHNIDDGATELEISDTNIALSPETRLQLVDWLVEIQINFDLDHEPLYMAVKLVDQYLMRKKASNYELLFMVSMLVAAKFDERIPPVTISELIQVAKSKLGVKYSRRQVICLEVDLLTTLDFDIRFPLSYGFLRRFARCTRSETKTLYLARYILESSLMDQDMIEVIESKLAAGSLLLAFNMLHKNGAWDETARFYTGYSEQDLFPLIRNLNTMLQRLSKRKTAIRRKYSHEPYMEVARIPMISF